MLITNYKNIKVGIYFQSQPTSSTPYLIKDIKADIYTKFMPYEYSLLSTFVTILGHKCFILITQISII